MTRCNNCTLDADTVTRETEFQYRLMFDDAALGIGEKRHTLIHESQCKVRKVQARMADCICHITERLAWEQAQAADAKLLSGKLLQEIEF